MRNLKKILALVLALVMSLSLMATAGASKFPDVDAENPYATAIDVLDGLKVFQGFEDGTFKPTDTLNRAQAAVLVYRIATGDVENKYLDNYTYMAQSKFTDLEGYNWAKGYINYCQNAGIVVGTTATTFDPGAKVTGYQLLVMLLRTLGYGKAGEFADPKGWELQTATIAEREGITKNVTAGDFGAPAPRQMVAEILFRGLLSESVEYSALIPGGYTKTGETLGMREFGLEKISGVVMANEWANLNDGAAGAKVLAAGTTQMVLEDGTTRTLSVATDLDAVGLTYNAYIANGEGGAKKSLTMEKSDINVVAFNEGQAVGPKGKTLYDENRRQGSIPDLADEEGLEITSSTGYYIDYDQGWYKDCTSDYQISYVVNVNMASTTTNSPGISLDEAETKEIITEDEHDDLIALIETAYGKKEADFPGNFVFSRSIRIGDAISETDLAIMESIFDLAGRYEANNPVVKGYTIGEVYVGTTQTKDYSDEMSWKAFKAEYLNNSKETVKFDYAQAGESLRVVDNNGDGDAEYVLKVTYTMDQVIGTYKDAPELNEWRVASKYKDNNLYQPDELAVGDVVVWNVIDGKLSLWKAESVTETIKTKTFKDITVTTTEDNTYGQSGITNNTGMDDLIMNMDEKVEYIMFKDRFGFIRAYTLAQGSQYALLTEMYPSGSQNWNYVRNTEWTAEMTMGDAETAEYKVVNMTGGKYDGSVFASNSVWTKSLRNHYQNEWNYLQPAVAHLGNPMGLDRDYNAGRTYTDDEFYDYGWYNNTTWNRMVMEMATVADTNPYGVFAYDTAFTFTDKDTGAVIKNEPAFSFTNVAAYVMDGEDVTLASAAKLAKNTNGEVYYYNVNTLAAAATNDDTARPAYGNRYVASEWAEKGIKGYATLKAAYDAGVLTPVYATDYVQLAKQDVKANTKHFDIHANYGSYYTANSNGYVNATVDTEFYIVTPDRITYKVGYGDLPTIKAGQIRAAYAVANNTRAAANGLDYWVADVIVIEVNKTESDWDSVSAVYYNPFETTGAIRYLNSLNSAWKTWQPDSEDKAILDVVPTVVTGGIVGNPNGSQSWGDNSWTVDEYGFYALYTTELDESGDLTAKEAKKITNDWNKYGIYAGTIQRIYQLTGSNYIDVDKEGHTYYGQPLTGAQVEALNVQDIPVYRVTTTSASEITLSAVKYSDVKVGDPIIWVYEKGSTSKIAYIIDLATVAKSYDTTVGNYPTWLKDGVNGDYDKIIAYQKLLGLDALDVTVLTDGNETATINTNSIKTNAGAGKVSTAGTVSTITIPEGATTVEFTVTTGGGLTADKLILAIDSRWVVYNRNDSGTTCTVTLIRKTSLEVKASAVTGTPVETLVGENTILTVDYLTNVIVARIADLTTQYAAASDADKAVIAKELNAIKESLELLQEPYAVVDAAAQTTVTTQIDAIEDVVGDGSEPDEDEAAAAKALVDAYEDYLLKDSAGLTPGTVQAALEKSLTAAVAYKDYYTVDGTADADVAYAELVDALDAKVKAVVEAAANLTDLAKIKTAVAAVEAAKAYANGLSLASWGTAAVGSIADVAAYNEKVTTINGKANLLTLAKNLVSTGNAWYATSSGGSTAGTASLWTAYKDAYDAVNALASGDKSIVSASTLTAAELGATGTTTTTVADAWGYYATGNPLQSRAATLVLEPADNLVCDWDAATKTLIVKPGTPVANGTDIKALFKEAASPAGDYWVTENSNTGANTWTSVVAPTGSGENWRFTVYGPNGGGALNIDVIVKVASAAEAAAYDLAAAVEAVNDGTYTGLEAAGGSRAAFTEAVLAAVAEALGDDGQGGGIPAGEWGTTITAEVALSITGDWTPVPEDGDRTVTATVTIKAGTATETVTLTGLMITNVGAGAGTP